jgi:hypothetical protein
VAQTTNPTITVNIGASGSNISLPKIQLFSGSCAGLTSISCSVFIPNPGSRQHQCDRINSGQYIFCQAILSKCCSYYKRNIRYLCY